MEQQIITLVNQRLTQLFVEVKNILLHPDNYQEKVETEHLFDYFRFIEVALAQPYNRLVAVTAFITDAKQSVLSHQMYPIALLRSEAKERIVQKGAQAKQYAKGLALGGFDPERKLLCTENIIAQHAQEKDD